MEQMENNNIKEIIKDNINLIDNKNNDKNNIENNYLNDDIENNIINNIENNNIKLEENNKNINNNENDINNSDKKNIILKNDITIIQSDEKLLNQKREPSTNLNKIIHTLKKHEKQKEKKKSKWYTPKINSNIYISNLPLDITKSELINYFSKCGFIRNDPKTNEIKVKIYLDKNNKPKGDALISYIRPESVDLAIVMLNNSEIRPGFKIKIEKGKFEQKGEYKKRETYIIDDLQRFKNKTDIDRKLGWEDEDQQKGLKIVIFQNMFDSENENNDFEYIENDVKNVCEDKCGKIKKIEIFKYNKDGIIKIKFMTPNAAEKCIKIFDNKRYNERKIKVFYWDGKTSYNI